MGYFANAFEGSWYEGKICERCAHYQDADEGTCAVWMVHLLYNYAAEGSETQQVLDELIPLSNVPGYNGLCNMYLPAKAEWANHGENYKKWLSNLEEARSASTRPI